MLQNWLSSQFGPKFDYLDSLIIELDGVSYLPVEEGLFGIFEIAGVVLTWTLIFGGFFWISVYAAVKAISILIAYLDNRRKKRISGASASENK